MSRTRTRTRMIYIYLRLALDFRNISFFVSVSYHPFWLFPFLFLTVLPISFVSQSQLLLFHVGQLLAGYFQHKGTGKKIYYKITILKHFLFKRRKFAHFLDIDIDQTPALTPAGNPAGTPAGTPAGPRHTPALWILGDTKTSTLNN
jgi:hypothetical protein